MFAVRYVRVKIADSTGTSEQSKGFEEKRYNTEIHNMTPTDTLTLDVMAQRIHTNCF